MSPKLYKVLAIEDDPSDASLIAHSLQVKTATAQFDLKVAETLSLGFEILEKQRDIDVLLLDLNLPDSVGIETFYTVHRRFPDLPIIILSSTSCEETYISAIDQGAQDYVSKDTMDQNLLTRSICYAFRRMQIRCELQQATKMKTDFLSHMSHEIRTPLNGVIGLTDLLLATNLDSKQRELATLAKESGELLLAIVNDILDISKIESGKIELDVSAFDLSDLVKSCVSMFKTCLEEKKLSFSLRIAPDVPRQILGDSTKIRQILINLLNNAFKFTFFGGVILKVDLLDQTNPQSLILKFSIEDTGIGIPSEKLKELFSPFSQAERSTARRFGGTGLGLAISKAFVTLMGGELTVESTEGIGSNFTFTLKLTLAVDAGQADYLSDFGSLSHPPAFTSKNAKSEPKQKNENQSLGDQAMIGPKHKALVVEDNFVNQKVIEAMMTTLGFEVTLAKSGFEALSWTSAGEFDVILMDCQMPEMDGFEATKRIREQQIDSGRRTPIVAITAGATSEERDRCQLSGMDDFISKPLKLATLDSALHRLLKSTEPAPANDGVLQQQVIQDLWSLGKRVGRDVLSEVFEIFEKRTGPMLEKIQDSLLHDDRTEVGKITHALKGSAMHLGATEMVHICEEIEQWVRTEKALPEAQLLEKLQKSFTITTSALRDEINRINR